MTRVLITMGALLAAAVALAGCGGSGSVASGTTVGATVGTTGGVAGVQTTQGSAGFSARVNNLQSRIRTAMRKLANGNVTGAASVGGTLLMNCQSTVDTKLAPHATTTSQKQAVSHLRTACADVSQASTKAAAGDLATAKQLAKQAMSEAQQAVTQLH